MTTNNRPIPSRIRVRPGSGAPPSVDGHPGWVNAENNSWGWPALTTVFCLCLLTGTGPLLLSARSASWWISLLGTALGALLTWLPLWGVMRAKGEALTLDEAYVCAFGGSVGGFLSLLAAVAFLLSAAQTLRILAAFVRLYMIDGARGLVVSLAALSALALMLCRRHARGFSRGAWGLRFVLCGLMAVSALMMTRNADAFNLFPLLGESPRATLASLPVALSNGMGVASLAVLPRLTGSAKPPRFRLGLAAGLLGALAGSGFVLLACLSVPPRSTDAASSGGIGLMLAIEYLSSAQIFRVLYQFALLLLLLISTGASLTGCGALLAGVWRAGRMRGGLACACLLASVISACPDAPFYQTLENTQLLRAAALALPAWAAWPILKNREKRNHAAR